ncbi:MAG TPA: hydroxymethylglutaryl-CoA reductase (NADPH) [Thermoanaerobaculia bacterium]|nr:hydroxymethylglutaryl-CoA reductase (NADPH) [Thermoanaerobaculia bacterium]
MTTSISSPIQHPRSRHKELVRALATGEIRFHQLPKDLSPEEASEIRRRALEEIAQTPLSHIAHHSLDVSRASKRHCENFIGVAQIPMGIVGPLAVRGAHADGDFYVPLATTEAALVASTNRGCTAIREAGGAIVRVEDVGMTRAPVFRTSGILQTQAFLRWIKEHFEELRAVCERTSHHLKLLEIRPFAFGTTVFLRFRFDSGDAMGMNMVTIACDRVVTDLIEPETGVACIGLSGNYCVDKKPADINFQEGRGKRIYAEILLDKEVLASVLKTTAKALVEVQYRKNLLGSIAAGSKGFNAHYANVLAAFFIATGQDPAHVVEGSLGVTCIEARGEDSVFASIFLPDVPIGAVGGGTGLQTQSEALSILGVAADPRRPGEAAMRLAEILGATVLAGELSLMAAFTSQDLANAHEKLGRGVDRAGRDHPTAVFLD